MGVWQNTHKFVKVYIYGSLRSSTIMKMVYYGVNTISGSFGVMSCYKSCFPENGSKMHKKGYAEKGVFGTEGSAENGSC